MSCDNVQELISPLLDRKVAAGERENVLAHLESCRQCSAQFESMQRVRAALRSMNRAPMPSALAASLRVMASHERQRLLLAAPSNRLRYWSDRAWLWFDNLMRPFALPAAGGVLSALVLFSILVPSLSFQHNFADSALFTYPDGEVVIQVSNGVYSPLGLSEEALRKENVPRLERVGAISADDANVVTLTIDENGRVSDYSLARGRLTSDLMNIIMFSQFKPATFLGVPTPSKVNAVQRQAGHTMRS